MITKNQIDIDIIKVGFKILRGHIKKNIFLKIMDLKMNRKKVNTIIEINLSQIDG